MTAPEVPNIAELRRKVEHEWPGVTYFAKALGWDEEDAAPLAAFPAVLDYAQALEGERDVMRAVLADIESAVRMGGLGEYDLFSLGFIWCQNQEALLAGETTWEAQRVGARRAARDAGDPS